MVETIAAVPELVPARMLNEFVYCPRLGFLEWVEGEFADNAFTEDGRYQHRRVDRRSGHLAPAGPVALEEEDPERPRTSRSVTMSAPVEGLIARMDVIEASGPQATPVDYKRGAVPDTPGGVYEPERVQLCAQGLILRENGFVCPGGWIYFTESRRRVWVDFDAALVETTRKALQDFRRTAAGGVRPPALKHSPKCGGCSLSGICLPDELDLLVGDPESLQGREEVRRLLPARDDALPLYVQTHGASVGISGETLQVREKGREVGEVRLLDLSQVNLLGNVQISTQAVRELLGRGIPISYFSFGGWYCGTIHGPTHKNILLRQAQYRAAADAERCRTISRELVAAKILNSRTLLRRNLEQAESSLLVELKELAAQALVAPSLETLLGVEGYAGRLYFQAFPRLFKKAGLAFDLHGRNRRPPLDPVNAMLSFGYSMLTRDLSAILQAVGFDPFQGYYHQPRYGRPALALDLMEPFRPLIVDSAVLWAMNNGVLSPGDFIHAANACNLSPSGRKSFIQAYERRVDELITHPVFGYRLSYRQLLTVQARLFGRYLAGELDKVPTFRTR